MNISGNTVLITGGATGIGLALAVAFLNAGNEVVICGRRASALAEAREQYPQLTTVVCDVSIEAERMRLITEMTARFPGFNVLVNNAGIEQELWFKDGVSADAITQEISSNLIAPIHFTSLVFMPFSAQPESAILNITSGLGFTPLAMYPVYGATKAGLHSFSITSRHQLKSTSIKVFEIIPPIVETELDHGRRAASGRQLVMIQPEEVATATMSALANDQYECAIGMAANLVGASRSENWEAVFERMNG